MESVIVGIVVIGLFVGVLGFAIYKQKKFEGVKADLMAQIESLKSRYNDLRK